MACQTNAMNIPKPMARSNSNKRRKSKLNIFNDDDETDAIVPDSENHPVFRQSKSEPVS